MLHGPEWERSLQDAGDTIKAVFAELPNVQILIRELLRNGGDFAALRATCHILPGTPLVDY